MYRGRCGERSRRDDVQSAVGNALRLGKIGFDAVKHPLLCPDVSGPPRLDLDDYVYLPRSWVDTKGNGIKGPMMTPVVSPLIDTSGDSEVNEQDVPAVISIADGNRLTAVQGDSGAEIFRVTDPLYRLGAGEEFSQIPVGDIEGDLLPEIMTVPRVDGKLIAFENDGTLKWFGGPVPGFQYGGPALADMDQDGMTEVMACATRRLLSTTCSCNGCGSSSAKATMW